MIWNLRLRSFIYLFVFCSTIRGSIPISQSSDHHPKSPSSSPYANVTENRLYSEWSGWSSCSSSCGLGIITRTRSCLKRAYNVRGIYVPLCHAEYSEHRICNLKPCPLGSPDIRLVQCSRHNNQNVSGKVVKQWLPEEDSSNPCELLCRSEELGDAPVNFGKVSNGIPCEQGVCLDGRCLKVGCDGRIGSGVSEDACGVCGGRNGSCVHYKDIFQGQRIADQERRNGYYEVVVLPVGARNVIIRQLEGKNYLALQDHTRGIIFNGEQHLSRYGGRFDIAGTAVQFLKSDNITETLTAKGPVTEELYVLVLLRDFNPGIYYEYWLPRLSYNPTNSQHFFQLNSPTIATTNISTTITTTILTTLKPSQFSSQYRHHPSKPVYAYPYGEKPYRSQDAPVFRHISHSTSHTPTLKQPSKPQPESNINVSNETYPKDANVMYSTSPFTPIAGYYENFRNLLSTENIPKIHDLNQELPALTQPEIGEPENRKMSDIVSLNSSLEDKKQALKSIKPPPFILAISKREGAESKDLEPNGRLKYTYGNENAQEVHLNISFHPTPSSIDIALLPDGKRDEIQYVKKKERVGDCVPCERSRDQIKHFCESDFVIRVVVMGYQFLAGETRYELDVVQTFRNTLSLLTREFVWSPGTTCRCPRMRLGKEYLVMGRVDNNYRKRESRLLVDKSCFVRTFNLKFARRLQKLKKDRTKRCIKIS